MFMTLALVRAGQSAKRGRVFHTLMLSLAAGAQLSFAIEGMWDSTFWGILATLAFALIIYGIAALVAEGFDLLRMAAGVAEKNESKMNADAQA
jgi:uncharacterized membrane protein